MVPFSAEYTGPLARAVPRPRGEIPVYVIRVRVHVRPVSGQRLSREPRTYDLILVVFLFKYDARLLSIDILDVHPQ
jgi:hypothetical protein